MVTHADINAYTHMYTQIQIQTHTHPHAHTRTHTHTHTHTLPGMTRSFHVEHLLHFLSSQTLVAPEDAEKK